VSNMHAIKSADGHRCGLAVIKRLDRLVHLHCLSPVKLVHRAVNAGNNKATD
jgi:hypothetical protein